MGLLTQKDSTILRNYFKEMAKLRGFTVTYIYPVAENTTIHGQILPEFSSEYTLDIVFESNPKIKTLKNYGWVSENNEDNPSIAYLPYDTPNIQTKARLKLQSIGTNKDGKWFEITDIHESFEYPDAYICKLAPVYKTKKYKKDYSETNNNYLESDNQPDEATRHIKEINKDIDKTLIHKDDNFKFLNI